MFFSVAQIVPVTTALPPLYENTSLWAVVVAAASLVVSVAPHVRRWLKGTRLQVEVHSRISLTHKLGLPSATLYVDLGNVGGQDIRVRSITAKVERDGKDAKTLSGQVFFETIASNSAILLVPFTEKPGTNWAHPINFYEVVPRQQEQALRKITSALREDIQAKKAAQSDADRSKIMVSGEPKLVQPFLDMFAKEFYWTPGEYLFYPPNSRNSNVRVGVKII